MNTVLLSRSSSLSSVSVGMSKRRCVDIDHDNEEDSEDRLRTFSVFVSFAVSTDLSEADELTCWVPVSSKTTE